VRYFLVSVKIHMSKWESHKPLKRYRANLEGTLAHLAPVSNQGAKDISMIILPFHDVYLRLNSKSFDNQDQEVGRWNILERFGSRIFRHITVATVEHLS
jgi:hypothetical protein